MVKIFGSFFFLLVELILLLFDKVFGIGMFGELNIIYYLLRKFFFVWLIVIRRDIGFFFSE